MSTASASGKIGLAAGWPYLPAAIAFVTAMIDVTTWLTLNHFYSSNITGDALQAAAYFVPGQQAHVLQVLSVPVFLVGVVAVYFVARALGNVSAPVVRGLLLAQFALLAVNCALSLASGSAAPKGAPFVVVGVLAVLAICLSNATLHLLDRGAATTWALTANTVNAVFALLNIATKTGSAAGRTRDRETWRSTWPVALSFLMGGVVATATVPALQAWHWAVPAVATLVVLAVAWRPATAPP